MYILDTRLVLTESIERSGDQTVRQLELVMYFAPKFVVRVLIRFVDVAKVIAERNYYIFAYELLDSI